MSENENRITISPDVALKLSQLDKEYAKLKRLMSVNYFFSMGLATAIAFLMLRLGNAFQLMSEQAS